MYFQKNKKYVEIVLCVVEDKIKSYKILMTIPGKMGWNVLREFKVEEHERERYVNEEMIKLILELLEQGYELIK